MNAYYGLLIVLALVVAGVFLYRSMTHQLRKVPRSFDPPAGAPAEKSPTGDEPDPTQHDVEAPKD